MNDIAIYLAAFALYILYIVNKSAATSIRIMSNPSNLFNWDIDTKDERFASGYSIINKWAQKNNFIHKHNFIFQEQASSPTINSAAWWSESTSTWCLMYVEKNNKMTEFVTIFQNDTSLTTGSAKDGHLFPKIDTAYVQIFPKLEIQNLHLKHIKSCSLIENNMDTKPDEYSHDLMELLPKHMSLQSKYLMTLPFWNFRGAYWYFIRRNFQSNNVPFQ